MPRIDIICNECETLATVFVAPSAWVPGQGDDLGHYPTPTCAEAGCGGATRQIHLPGNGAVVDDTLPGGARWMHNLGDRPVWVETKTQFKNELSSRGLVHAPRDRYNRDDRSPYATRTRLRPGQRDPFVQGASRSR